VAFTINIVGYSFWKGQVTSRFLDSFLSRHHQGMPNFFLTYTEIGDVSAYILTLRK
jgi:hypothetical protein